MDKAQQANDALIADANNGRRSGRFILQRVVSRKFVGFRPNPTSAPNKILHYVVESLDCGHKMPVYPVEGETFTARKRSCHECLNEFVKGLELKKPVSTALHGAALTGTPRKTKAKMSA